MTTGRWSLPKLWVWVPTAEIAEIIGGGTPSTKDEANFLPAGEGVPWIGPADLTKFEGVYISAGRRDLSANGLKGSGATILPKGTVLFTSRAPIGYCVIAKNPISTNQGFKSLVCSKEIIPEYMRYYLKSSISYVDSFANGTTFREISGKKMAQVLIPLPPLAEQRRIVAKLDSLTARIARARAELERVRTLSFRAWKSAINQSFQKFKCDNVPLKQIAQITGGLTKNAKRSSLPLQVPYLRVANVYANELRLSDVAKIGCSEKEYKKTKLERNDLLIVEGNGSIDQVGRAARWNGEIDGCTHQNHLIRIRPYESMSSDFLLFFLESSLGRKYIETSASSTSGLHTLSISKIGNFLCPLPSRPLQALTVKYLNLCRDRFSKQRIEIDRALALLDRLESSLLAKAFRGELVPQDPTDEPASVLLDRIRTERAAVPKPGRKRKA